MTLEELVAGIRKKEATESVLKEAFRQLGILVPRGITLTELPPALDLSFPVVLKVSDDKILHKTEVGGVVTGIRNMDDLKSEFTSMRAKFPGSRFLVEEMVEGGLEMITGIVRDKNFGLCIMIGMGGIYTELYGDVTFRLLPIDAADADDMIDEVSLGRFTGEGFRGIRADRKSIVEFLLKISEFGVASEDFLEQLDLNPVKINYQKIYVLDAKLIKTKLPEQRRADS
ncbi:MAG: acetate--CoA ligase family protein [Thermoplasmata archaeon]